MALGGGTFTAQNKLLPGSYINFVSAARATSALSDRGVAAMPLELDWGVEGEVFAVENTEFQKNSQQIFGYGYGDEKLKGLRDLFRNIKTGYFYRVNGGGTKAANDYAEALYSGTVGNGITIVIEANEDSTEEHALYNVYTLLNGARVEEQRGVASAAELESNQYVAFKPSATLAVTAGSPLTGGASGTVQSGAYQTFLDKIESYSFHVLGCPTTDEAVKGLMAAFTKRMRDEAGVKFQCVLHQYADADYEGVISVQNNSTPELVYWTTGAAAGCAVNASNTNRVYDGEYAVDTDATQAQLEQALASGAFLFHRVGDQVRVLEDINTFVSVTDEKSSDFRSNQVIRVLDQIGNDIAALFHTRYLGRVQNDNAGRISLWNDIVKHHQDLQAMRAIENFSADDVTVEQGETKKSVVVSDSIVPVGAMSQLYMTVVVN